MSRLRDLVRFYELLGRLEGKVGGTRTLAESHGRMDWPDRGVYFFFEPGEIRTESGSGPRVVRVGTHALTDRSRTTLWNRLSQHRGVESTGGGNHRGSIFRLIVGAALKQKTGLDAPHSWGVGSHMGAAARKLNVDRSLVKDQEQSLEQTVSKHIGSMPFLWLSVDDAPRVDSLRGRIERNSIALLSNYERDQLDLPSEDWLGHHSDRGRIRQSGLWNSNHVDETYDANYLFDFERLVDAMDRPS